MTASKFIITTLLALSITTPAHARVSGESLKKLCELDRTSCDLYIAGAWDTLNLLEKICPPAVVPNDAMTEIVIRYMRDNPEELKYSAAVLVTISLGSVFACK